MSSKSTLVGARFLSRPNRFLVRAELEDGRRVSAYLPNTGRLTHLLAPGRPLILRHDGLPPRTTQYTAIRAWDGCWVALEAGRAPALLASWLKSGNKLPGFDEVVDVATEVTVEGHRLDLLVHTAPARVWVEVKSGGRCGGGTALLSATPSQRGVAHLAALGRLVESGEHAAAAFVIQRGDARALLIGGDADWGWVEAVHSARAAGVAILAFGCDVTAARAQVSGPLPVLWE